MSESDSFINEVAEEVRRDRLYRLGRRYAWIPLLLVVVIVGAASFLEWRKAQDVAQARALGDSMFAALEASDSRSRLVALEEIDAEGTAEAIRKLLAASEAASVDTARAADLLEAVSADETLGPVYRDLATLRLTMLQDYPMFSEEKLTRLEPLTAPGAPLRLSALEQTAYVHADRDERTEAIAILRRIVRDAEASSAQQQRALQMIVALGGDVEQS